MPDNPPVPSGWSELPPPPAGWTPAGGSATPVLGKWSNVTEDQIQGVRDKFFNTTNRKANAVIQAADAYSRTPNDPALRAQILSMNPVTQAAIIRKAQEFKQQDAQNADTQMHVNPYTAPVFTSKSTGKIVQPNEMQGVGELLHGPEGYRKLQQSKKFGPTIQKGIESLLTPSGVSLLGSAMLVPAAAPFLAPAVGAGLTTQMAGAGLNSILRGDTEEGLANLTMATLPAAAGMFKGTNFGRTKPVDIPEVPPSQLADRVMAEAGQIARHRAEPPIEPQIGKTNRPRPRGPQPTIPAQSPVDTSQPMFGAEGVAPLGRPPFATTYQQTAPPSATAPELHNPITPEPLTLQQHIDMLNAGVHPNQGAVQQALGGINFDPMFAPDQPKAPIYTPEQEAALLPRVVKGILEQARGKTHSDVNSSQIQPDVAPLAGGKEVSALFPTPAHPAEPIISREIPEDIPSQVTGLSVSKNIPEAVSGPTQTNIINSAGEVVRRLRSEQKVVTNDPLFDKSLTPDVKRSIINEAQSQLKAEKSAAAERAQIHAPKKTGGTLNTGIGPTGTTGEDPLITADKLKRFANSLGADNVRDLLAPVGAPERLKQAGDKARDLFTETGSYTNRVAPDTMRKAIEFDNASKVTKASVEKIGSSLDGLPRIGKTNPADLFQRMLTADKQLTRGVPITDSAISEADVRAYFAHPKVRQILPKYNRAVQEVYDPLRGGAGYGESNLYGKYSKSYSPSINEEQIGQAGGGPSAPGSKPLFVPNKTPGEVKFTGLGNYLQSLEGSHEFRLGGLTRASGQRQILTAGMREGVVKPVPEGFDNTMMVNKQSVPAIRVSLSKWGLGPDDLARVGLPEEVIMPNQVAADLEPAFKKSMKPFEVDEPSQQVAKRVMQAVLWGTSEAGAHDITLPGIAGTKVQFKTGMPGLDAVLNAVGPVRSAARMKDMVRMTRFTDGEIADARVLGAKAGVFRDDPFVGAKTAADKAKVILSNPGGASLYGKRGTFNNIVTGMVKVMKSQGKSETEIIDALRALPNRSGSFVPDFQKVVERVMGPGFYSTGKAALRAGVGAMTPRNIVGALAFYTLAGQALDEDGKAWYDRGLMPGEFVRGHDKDGTAMKWDLATLDRMFRVQREVPGKTFQESQVNLPGETVGDKGQRVGETAGLALLNQLIRPALTGPTASLLSQASGVVPYLVKNQDKYNPKALDTPTASQPYLSWDRLKAMGGALLPGSQTMLGDVNNDYRTNTPTDENLILINRILRGLGQRPGTKFDEDASRRNAIRIDANRRKGAAKGSARAESR